MAGINPNKILIINTFGIGDVIFTTPFVRNLKYSFPRAAITYLCNRRTAPLLSNYEKINHVFVYERDEFNELYKKNRMRFFREVKGFYKTLKNEDFDIVFDFSLNRSADFLTWFLGIKRRIGFNYKNRSPLLTDKVEFEGFETKHVVEYYLDILRQLNVEVKHNDLEITVSEGDRQWADNYLKSKGLGPGEKLVGIMPGAGASWGKGAVYRRWEAEKYAKLVDKIIEISGVKTILMGDKSEEALCSQVSRSNRGRIIEAFGETTLGQLAALLEKCRLVVMNDGGPLHIAVAVGTKTVSIFGPVDYHVYGPYGNKDNHLTIAEDIACRPCYRNFRMTDCDHICCLRMIEVEDVFKRVEKML